MTARKNPSDFLSSSIGSSVIVRLYSGIDYHGKLTCLDGYLNIALEGCSEVSNGIVTFPKMGDTFIRGNNGKNLGSNYSIIHFKSIIDFQIVVSYIETLNKTPLKRISYLNYR